jgi:ClpP class serine protease
VAAGRQGRLKADLDLLSRAEIFDGIRAEELGLIDGLRSTSEAIAEAADLAGLRRYDVVELYPLAFADESGSLQLRYAAQPLDMERLWAAPATMPPGFYYRYMELPGSQ